MISSQRPRRPSHLVGVALVGAWAAPLAAQARPAPVALVLDQDSPRFQPLVEGTWKEIPAFLRRGEIGLLPVLTGNGTVPSVSALLGRTFYDRSVAVVVALLLVPVFYSISVLDLRIGKWAPGRQ